MKQLFIVLICFLIGPLANSQSDSVRGNRFQLIGKIKRKVRMSPACGHIAWAAVIEFEVIELIGMSYPNKSIGIIFTCPEFYKHSFFKKGSNYKIVFSDENQAGFKWAIMNKEVLKKNSVTFEPYAISAEKL